MNLCENCGQTFESVKCPHCAEPISLQENIDYYFENGLMVFTEAYHLKRGYCCKSGCRHCPYGFSSRK